jgi:hypothetical protein
VNDFARFHFIFLTQCASEGGPQLYEIEGFLRHRQIGAMLRKIPFISLWLAKIPPAGQD